jgi:hypothetical protein
MELLNTTSMSVRDILVCLTIIVGLVLYSDLRSIRAARRIRQYVTTYVDEHYQPTVTVVIPLTRSAETIQPLLDHLYSYRYANFHVVVHIKHTAGKYAQSKLSAYRRRKQFKHLKLIKHTKGVTSNQFLRRHTAGDYVMYAAAHDLYSPNFFTAGTKTLLDHNIDGVLPQRQVNITNTLLSAFQSLFVIFTHFSIHLGISQPPVTTQTGILYRRTAILDKAHHDLQLDYALNSTVTAPSVVSWHALATSHHSTVTTSRRLSKKVIGFSIGVGALTTGVFLSNQNMMTTFLLFLICIGSASIVFISSSRERSVYDKCILLLVLPFSPVIICWLGLQRARYRVVRIIRNSAKERKRQFLLTK